MPDFGNAGQITQRVDHASTVVNRSNGEYLFYKVTVSGAKPKFTYVFEQQTLSQNQFDGDPKEIYEWTWCRSANLSPDSPNVTGNSANDTQEVQMHFLTAIKYTLLIEQRHPDDSLVKVLKDVDYASQDPSDTFFATLQVLTQ